MGTDKRLGSLETLFKALADPPVCGSWRCCRRGKSASATSMGASICPNPPCRATWLTSDVRPREGAQGGALGPLPARQLPDPVAQTVVDAVNHALGHVHAGEKDPRRLLKMADVTALEPQPRTPCCSRRV